MTTASPADQRKLLDLQALDTKMAKLAHQRRSLPVLGTLQELAGRSEDLHGELALARTEADDARRELAKAEADVEQVRTRSARHQATLDSGKGLSRELLALQQELEQLAARQAVLEEAQLEVMERLEAAEERVHALEVQEQSIRADVVHHTAARDAEFARIDTDITQTRTEREQSASSLDPELVDLYEQARSQTGGLGAVAVHGYQTEGVNIEFTLSERSWLESAPDNEVLLSEDHGFILVRLSAGETSGRA